MKKMTRAQAEDFVASHTWLPEFRSGELLPACPMCDAGDGQPCVVRGSGKRAMPHSMRIGPVRAMLDAGEFD